MSGVLVLDIETVPDTNLWQPAPSKPVPVRVRTKADAKEDAEFLRGVIERITYEEIVHADDIARAYEIAVRSELIGPAMDKLHEAANDQKNTVAPAFAQRPITIGCLWLDDQLTCKKIGVIGSGALHADERKLLGEWADFMAREKPKVVTWNGRSFDMPVLTLRSFRHGVPLPWYFANKNYRYRYSDECHLDLMDVMSDYGATGRTGFKLDAVARAIGLPGKYGVDGSLVAGMYTEGKQTEIDTYCMTDVIQTAFVYLRWVLVKGFIDLSTYQAKACGVLESARRDARLQEFCKLIDEHTLLLHANV